MNFGTRRQTISGRTEEELASCLEDWKQLGWREVGRPRRARTLRGDVFEQDLERIASRNPLAGGEAGISVAWFS